MFTFQFLNDRIYNYLSPKKHNCEFYHSKIEKYTHFPQKIYKLNKTNIFFSHFERKRADKTQIFRTLVHSWVESAKEKPGSWTYEGKSLSSIDDIKTAGQMRILTVHEVGQGLIKALEYDNVITKSFHFLLKNLYKVKLF